MQFLSILIFLLFLYFYISTIWTNAHGAPWVPTGRSKIKKMLAMADLKPGETIIDLGAGDGRVLRMAARQFGAQAIGIEIDPVRYLWNCLWVKIYGLSDKIQVIRGDFFKTDLSGANVVFCYLLPKTNRTLQDKLLDELSPGTRIICNTFPLPGLPIANKDDTARIYLHIL